MAEEEEEEEEKERFRIIVITFTHRCMTNGKQIQTYAEHNRLFNNNFTFKTLNRFLTQKCSMQIEYSNMRG